MSARQELNQPVIEEFRARGGIVGGPFEGTSLVLLTTTGARTGEPRTTPLAYLDLDGVPVVFAFNGGRPNHPAWVHNIRVDARVTVEVGDQRFDAVARELDGEERERVLALQLERHPEFGDFVERAGRLVPVVVLERPQT